MKLFFRKNYKFIFVLIFIIILLTIKLPFYIDAPGGISDISKKIEIEGYESRGSFNLAYVREYNATLPTLLISLFDKNWEVLKKEEVLLENDTNKSYQYRDKLLMDESISNAIYVSYKYASKNIKILSNKIYVTYILDESDTSLKIGDEIKRINGIKIYNKEVLLNEVKKHKNGDKLEISVINNNKKYNRYAKIKNIDNKLVIGILLGNINEYSLNPNINVNKDSSESGSSGGLMMSLCIYNSLIKSDITHGLKIVGTGTIDMDGNIGSIAGIKHKLKSAVSNKADLFIVPVGENYKEAIKLKNDNNYKIKIIGVSTFKNAIQSLKNL